MSAALAAVAVFTAYCLQVRGQGKELVSRQGQYGAGGDMAGKAVQIERLVLVRQGLMGLGVTCFLPEIGLGLMTAHAALMAKQGDVNILMGPACVEGLNLFFDPGDDGPDLGCLGHGVLQGQKIMVEGTGCVLPVGMVSGQGLLQLLDLPDNRLPILFNQFDLVKVVGLLQIHSSSHPLELPVEGADPVPQFCQFCSLRLAPSAAFMPVNRQNSLILALGRGLGDQGIVDLLRHHVAAVLISRQDEVERRELPGDLLIFGRREAGEQDQDITLGAGFFQQGGKQRSPVGQGDARRKGGNSTGQADDPCLDVPGFFDQHRGKQRASLFINQVGGQPRESLLPAVCQYSKARGQIEGTDCNSVHLHGPVDFDDSLCCQELLGWPVR